MILLQIIKNLLDIIPVKLFFQSQGSKLVIKLVYLRTSFIEIFQNLLLAFF
jgi:hypothetical protein